MDAVEVVAPDDVEVDGDEMVLGRRVAGIQEVSDRELLRAVARARQPAGVARRRWPVPVEDVARVLRRRLVAPDGHGVDPGVHLQAGRVRRGDDVGQGIERRIVVRVVERRFEAARVEGVAAAPHLHDERVDVNAPRVGHELRGFLRRADAGVEGVDPERAEFRRRWSLGRRRERGQEGHKQGEQEPHAGDYLPRARPEGPASS